MWRSISISGLCRITSGSNSCAREDEPRMPIGQATAPARLPGWQAARLSQAARRAQCSPPSAEGRHLTGERLREGRPRLAPLLVRDQYGVFVQQIRMAEEPQDRRHEDVGRRERSDEMRVAVEAGGELHPRSLPPFSLTSARLNPGARASVKDCLDGNEA